VLERLGWTFVRIRGSQFLRDPDRTMEPVLAKLTALGLEPGVPRAIGEAADIQSAELRVRVVRRAMELRRRWRDHDPMSAALAFEARLRAARLNRDQ